MDETVIIERDGYLYTKVQEANSPPSLSPLQKFLFPYEPRLEAFFWVIWIVVLSVVIRRLLILSISSKSS
jgi:hypothetical protein